MNCEKLRAQLGEYHDGELSSEAVRRLDTHLAECGGCREALESIRALATRVEGWEAVAPPANLWQAIANRLDRRVAAHARSGPLAWRPLATAAAVLLVVGLGWLFVGGPGTSTATAHEFDFTPLLNNVGDDLGIGLRALIERYGGRSTTLDEAAKTMRVRVHPPEELPGEMRLRSMHMVNMGDHESLTFHFAGPRDQMLVMQCPPGMRKQYGGRECLPCTVGARPGQVVREGPWRLVHVESENVCICVVSRLDESTELAAVLELLRIDY
ncbi:MAG: zf-HC2 domain-containing protein [Planctomycetes bacterium]|nr:zf-HC2 domain-containing protein [Planctomycetota bacterium]